MSCPPPNPPPVVIDNGSWTIKAGLAGDRAPRLVIPSTSFIENGRVVDWDGATKAWKETFDKLGVSPDKQPVLLTEAALVSKADREKMTEVMFEKLNAKSIYLASQSILSLYACGLMQGTALQMGYGATQIVSCHNGNPVLNTAQLTDFAGQKLDDFMGKLLKEEGVEGLGIESIRDIKEKHSYVSLNYDSEEQQWESTKKKYVLPNGKEVLIGKARFTCPEALFRPDLAGQSCLGVQRLLVDGITAAAAVSGAEASNFYGNIVIAGGSSLFPGMAERVKKEVQSLAPPGTTVNVIAATDAINSSFIGGSILSCLENMKPLWVTREMYNESGIAIVHQKCI